MQKTELGMKREPGHWREDRQSGAMLIIALGVLTLLAVLGASFAQLMRLERKAINNYVDAQRMELVSNSALDMMIAKLHEASNHYSWSFYGNTDWLFRISKEDDLAHGRVGIEDPRVGRWSTYLAKAGTRFQYKTKVIDTNAQINLNGRQDTLARMLDNLGLIIEKSDRLKRRWDGVKVTNPFYTGPNRTGKKLTGEDVMLFRQRLEGQRFQSKNQLRQLIGDENFNIVKDFLTCHSWLDPYTYKADDGDDEVQDLALGRTRQAPAGGAGGGGVLAMPSAVGSPRLGHEPRHPININTAPEEVLMACFMGLAGRRTFPYSSLGFRGQVKAVDQGAQILGERVFADEEIRDVTPRPVFVYTPAIKEEHAKKIVQKILSERKIARRFFRTWRTNDPSQPGFEDFIDGLDAGFFPSFNEVIVIDPDQPNQRAISNQITGGGATPIGRLWQKGTAQGAERNTLRKLGLAVHDSNAWYYELIKGVIKANFNPNTRISRYNPNTPVYLPVDKSDLVWADPSSKPIPLLRKGHTTEFCFGPMGTFEITTLGQMVGDSVGNFLDQRRTVVGNSKKEPPADLYPFRRKIRTVVKVFDVLRHTNQFHFEKSFRARGLTSTNDRKFVQTWPEPMNALTELYTQGSRRDGRIELAGLLDGRRQQTAYNSRTQMFGLDPSILAEHSFSERDPQNVSRLRRSLQGSGVSFFGDEVSDALKGVFDFNFSRYQKKYREFYRLKILQNLNVFRGNRASQYVDPIVGKEEIGTDLLPDGLNTSLFRMQHLGNRLLVLPARQRIGEVGLGGGNIRIGSSGVGSRGQNIIGNVPYYRGGIGFWAKFEFDGDDPVFSGLIGCTQVVKEVLPAPQEFSGSEGSQFFLFKNTTGQLRLVRMYYHQAFPEGGAAGGAAGAGGRLHPDPGSDADGAPNQGENPLLEHLDQKKIISRADIVADIRHFKAHEWHHIAFDWDDDNPVFPIRLYIDFKEVTTGGTPRRAQQLVDGEANSWVRLNQRQPIDGLMVGGIVRNQAVPDAGVFKWFTTTAKTGRGGVTVAAPSVKRIIANATIDELIVYQGTFPQVKRYYGANAGAGYFTQRTGEYANLFEVPLPPGVNSLTLRSLDWTAYYPTTFTDSLPNSTAVQVRSTPLECDVNFNTVGARAPRLSGEPWRSPSVPSPVANKKILREQVGVKGANAELVYKFYLKGSKSLSGNTAGGVVQTPVIDDVTLSYYLPNPKILLQEDVD
ncbi:MAG: hypothetical protein VX254_00130 [Planctomycetota bacterium]|nr:hypothetical protein [Planctomycetota bacterium]